MSRPKGTSPSPRALEILGLLANGMTLRQVARSLYITESTAKTHQQRAFELLGVRTAAHAVAVAISEGLIEAPPVRSPERLARLVA